MDLKDEFGGTVFSDKLMVLTSDILRSAESGCRKDNFFFGGEDLEYGL